MDNRQIIFKNHPVKSSEKLMRDSPAQVCYTNDKLSCQLVFEISDCTEAELTGLTASIMIFMKDGSFFQDSAVIDAPGKKITYVMLENQVAHAGDARASLVLTAGSKGWGGPDRNFTIISDLGQRVATEVMIKDWTMLTAEARAYLDEFAANEVTRQQTAAAAESARAQTFTANEAGRQSTFSANEATRETNETARKAAEVVREAAHAERTSTFNSWVDPVTGLDARIDNIITTTAEGVSALEIIDARDGEVSVGAKIRSVDAQLAQNTTDIENRVVLNKNIRGGQFPEPFRVPVITKKDHFPNNDVPYYPLYIDGNTIYAISRDNNFRKSTDGGNTWEAKGYQSSGIHKYGLIKSNTGALLGYSGTFASIRRSEDDRVTWKAAFSLRTGAVPLGSQSMAVDKVTGYIYFGEYNIGSFKEDEINLYRSTDDGVTWEVFKTFPRTGDGAISHIHAVQWDHVAERIVICIGDGKPTTGLWRVNQDGTDVEPMVTNGMLPSELYDAPRAIGIIPFENYIAWGSDSGTNPFVFRMARSEIGKENPTIERIYRLNSTAWFTCKASDDGKTWVLTSSQEFDTSREDNLVHVYAVTDDGATVWEVGALAHDNRTAPASSLMPLGEPGIHGDVFSMNTRAFRNDQQFTFQLGRGFGTIEANNKLPRTLFTQTVSTGPVINLEPNEELIIARGRTAFGSNVLRIHEVFKMEVDDGGVPANSRIIIRERNGKDITTISNIGSAREQRREGASLDLESHSLGNTTYFEIVLKNTHAGVSKKIYAHVVYSLGL